MLLYTRMKRQVLIWNLLTLMIFGVNSVDILMDPGMREGKSSYVYCDIGAVTAGVTFYTEPNNVQGSCFGSTCVSTLYTITKNATGINLAIASVDASREEGEWYCQHDTDRSNTIMVNNHTIAGILLGQNWTEPSGPVDTFSAVMTLSCTNKVPNVSFTYEDSESNTGIVPTEAVSMTTQSSYDGTTCENGNKFYEITFTASNRLDIFNNKKGVKFFFTSNGVNITAPFSVDFTAFSGSTTESPNTTVPDDTDCLIILIIIIIIIVILVLALIIFHIVIFYVKVSFKVMGILFFVNVILAVAAIIIGIVGIVAFALCEVIAAIIAIVLGVLTHLYKFFLSKHVLKKAGVPHRHLCGYFYAYPWKTDDGDAPNGDAISTPVVRELVEVRNENNREDQNQGNRRQPPTSGNTNGTRVNGEVGAVGGETEENREGDSDTRTDYVNIPDAGLQPNQTKDGSNDPYVNVWNNGKTGNDSPNKENGNDEKEEGSKPSKKIEESTEHHYESLKKT